MNREHAFESPEPDNDDEVVINTELPVDTELEVRRSTIERHRLAHYAN